MKVKVATALIVLALGATSTFAQKGVVDGSRFGHGQDSINCLKNISIYSEYVKTGNFKDAYPAWKQVFQDAPLAQVGTYTNGTKILSGLIAQEKDPAKKAAYINELFGVYDQRIKYLDVLNTYVKNPTTKGSLIGREAHDYLTLMGDKADIKKAYDMLKSSIDEEKENSEAYLLQEFLFIGSKKLKTDSNFKEQFIQDYLTTSDYLDKGKKLQTKDDVIAAYKATKENLDALFINSGVATCENLQSIYEPKVKENKSNFDYLKGVLSIMRMMGCTESEVYFTASEYSNAISPTAESALGCGAMYYKRGNTAKAIDYFEQAIKLEDDRDKKADYSFNIAAILAHKREFGEARHYAAQALQYDPSMGKAQLIIANCIAANAGGYSDPVLRGAVYCAAYDAAMRAKSIDPKVSGEASRLAGSFRSGFPKRDDVFMDPNYKEGQSISVAGVTTTLRCR